MQLIAVDIGNSLIKIASEVSLDRTACPDADRQVDDRWWSHSVIHSDQPIRVELDSEPALWSVSSVSDPNRQKLEDWIAAERPSDQIHRIKHADIPLPSDVEDRESVGIDRLVAAWMAWKLNDKCPVIVIDAGTAVTIDVVDVQNIFQGGLIFPGATRNLITLSSSTAALPDLSEARFLEHLKSLNQEPVGKSTIPAIIKGVYSSQIGAIQSITTAMAKHWRVNPTSVYATGGGIGTIQEFLPGDSWNYVPDLVLQGAKEIGKRCLSKAG